MKAKNQLFEVAMESGNLSTAITGFIGIRQKVSRRTRLYLEATTLLAICYLRKKDLASARPYILEAFEREKNIISPERQSEYRLALAKRFDEEALLASLSPGASEQLDIDKIQDEAGKLIYSKHEDDILELLGASVPEGALEFVNDVHKESQGLLTYEEKKKLPSPAAFEERKKLGKGVLSAFQAVIWRSFCDKNSEVYKMWFTNGMQAVLDKKYITASVVSALSGLSIGVYAIAVYLTALLIKMGIETFCSVYKPSSIMGLRH
ncbi:hypothetical protein [Billgrantia antri]|uniref:Uncharacterized protein n=1 Tax=Billgrantia antri TaxID=2846777 RepID=A0ABS6ZMP3_9GAMM|nr:hypothetical protein [Halomonas antri]MBW6391323.1 hypothetical protein [Halomonas antri]